MVNYQEGLIYKIAHKYSPYVYIGSTTNFNRRKSQHKECCNNKNSTRHNFKVYQIIRECGGWDNFEMVLVAKCPCDDKKELHAKEFEYQQLFHANLNTQDAVADPEWQKKYNEKHYEEIKKYKKIYREKNKEYYQKYRQENREKLNLKQSQKVECECGCIITKTNIYTHRKSQRHINLMSA